MFLRLLGCTLLSFLLVSHLHAGDYNPAQRQDVSEFIEEMVNEHQMDRAHLKAVFKEVNKRQDILDLIAKPAERVLGWHEYRKIFITPKRIAGGHKFMTDYAAALKRAEQEYGVPAEVITSIIGVETYYGGNKGRHRVIDALATLSFDYPPRAKFFRGQLVEFLNLTNKEGLNPLLPMGSYAGAMGYPQFIPTSYRDFAVDYDGDGFADIWTNPVDAIGSVANYFVAHGWQKDQPVVEPVKTLKSDKKLPELRLNRFNRVTLGEAKSAGIIPANQKLKDDLEVIPMAFALEEGEVYFLGRQNFYTITRYNHSRMYALAVYELAEALRN
ncbi:lytic murein transglycosylase B [Marinospirillum insulare]|uniref:Murein transglycosylase n=1 Tax=Marinospirillum insulare TaxID=217169 RepID=A0ABQ5ZXE2_9GAMM|nr:lytic murein transglycosylase B [Marinospirillum insulare]GLR62658.1 murein transglycosylase [Marinospirillum insulare]